MGTHKTGTTSIQTFLRRHLALLLDWAGRARAEVDGWPSTEGLGLAAEARQIEQMLDRGDRDLGLS